MVHKVEHTRFTAARLGNGGTRPGIWRLMLLEILALNSLLLLFLYLFDVI